MSAIWPGVLVLGYLTAGGVLLVVGKEPLGWGAVAHLTAMIAVAIATCSTIVPRRLRAWVPLFAVLFLYSEVPLLISAAGRTREFDPQVMRWEVLLFGGQPALTLAARWPMAWLSEVLHTAYLSYYAIIYAVPLGLFASGRDEEFNQVSFALMLTFVTCFVCYVVFPVAGPRYVWPPGTSGGAGHLRTFALWLLDIRSARGTAFPSSHVAVATAQSILAVRFFGLRGLVVAALNLCLAVGAVYGGFHYAVDVLSGAVLGAVVTSMALMVTSKRGAAPTLA